MKKCALICNLESGRGIKKQELENIKKKINSFSYEISLYITKEPGDATKIVKNLEEIDLVLSIGGDGTFNEIVTGNLKRKKKLLLSHIPVGTTNDIGNMLGMSKNYVKNIENILNGEIKKVDIGVINKQPFVYVAGFGKFINVPYATNRKFKKNFGYFAYLINGVKEFFQKTKLYDIEYTIDDKEYRGLFSLILISNANRIAGFNNIYKEVKLDDNKFEVMFCNLTRRKDLVKSILLLLSNDITNIPGIYCYKASNISLKFKDNLKRNHWTIDGEKLKEDTKKYNINIDQEIEMLLPRKNLKTLFKK